jgi:hypothetical protein
MKMSGYAALAVVGGMVLFGGASVRAEWVTVERVIDGDTFVLPDGTRVRVKDIDTPETKHPTKGKEPGGELATELAKQVLEGKMVWLEGESKDKYGRRVADVNLTTGKSYADIVRANGLDKNALKKTTSENGPAVSAQTKSSVSTEPKTAQSATLTGGSAGTAASSASTGGCGRSKSVYVHGYTRGDGIYVKPYYRRAPSKK